VVFRIYLTPTGGSALWGEIQTLTVDRGYFSVLLGQGASDGGDPWTNNLTAVFSGPNASDRYVGITVNGITTPPTEVAPRLRLLASPYAFLAANANALVSSSGQELITTADGFVGINKTNASPASALDVSGTVSATAFAGSGAGLTNLNLGNITSGTLADARLSANVALLNGNQFFSGTPTFNGGFALANGATVSGNLNFSGSPTFNDGFALGGSLRLSNLPIYLRSGGDTNNGLVYGGSFAGGIDGPALFGNAGGCLGTLNGGAKQILTWTSSGEVVVPNGGMAINSPTDANEQLLMNYHGGNNPARYNGYAEIQAVLQGQFFTDLALNPDGGFVGVGLAYPTNTLHVAGPSGNQLLLQNSSTLYSWRIYTESSDNLLFVSASGNYGYLRETDGSWQGESDGRLKKDIEAVGPVLDRVLKLRPVSYRMKTMPESTPKSLGFIAQEVEPLFPEVVSEARGMKGMAYSELVPVAVGAVQELNQKVESQDKEIRDLKGEVERLRGLVEELAKSQAAPAPAAGAR